MARGKTPEFGAHERTLFHGTKEYTVGRSQEQPVKKDCSDANGGESMKLQRISMFTTVAVAAALMAGCATPPQGNRPVSKVAYVTSGGTYFYGATSFGPEISVVEIDAKAVAAPADPLELQPGTHTLKMKCGENVSMYSLTARAGEVYQYVMRAATDGKGCRAALARVRTSY